MRKQQHSNEGGQGRKPTAGQIVKIGAKAIKLTPPVFLDQLAHWVSARGEASELTRETILGYLHDPQRRCGFRLASSAWDFVEGRGVKEGDPALRELRKLAWAVLDAEAHRRYPDTRERDKFEPGASRFSGVFGLTKQDLFDRSYRQELLILEQSGRRRPIRWVTYISKGSVLRGSWHPSRGALYCTLSGRQAGGIPEQCCIMLAREANDFSDLIAGLMLGTSTAEGSPFVAPILLARVPQANAELMRLAHAGDAFIRKRFADVNNEMGNKSSIFRETLEKRFPSINLRPLDAVSSVRSIIKQPTDVIADTVLRFCTSFQLNI